MHPSHATCSLPARTLIPTSSAFCARLLSCYRHGRIPLSIRNTIRLFMQPPLPIHPPSMAMNSLRPLSLDCVRFSRPSFVFFRWVWDIVTVTLQANSINTNIHSNTSLGCSSNDLVREKHKNFWGHPNTAGVQTMYQQLCKGIVFTQFSRAPGPDVPRLLTTHLVMTMT
jgi:hypothetical protein